MRNSFGRALARVTIISVLLAGGTGLFAGGAAGASDAAPAPTGLDKVQHIVVIYLENWSFDSLHGNFPGADGLAQTASAPLKSTRTASPTRPFPRCFRPRLGTRERTPL